MQNVKQVNSKSAVGRPREFDQDKALEEAMIVFWQKGYERASVADLLSAMKINRGSMYSVFGDKEALFDAAIERYQAQFIEPFLDILQVPGSALHNIGQFFEMVEEESLKEDSLGCMICNTLIERANCCAKSRAAAQKFLLLVEARFYQTLCVAQADEEISKELDIKALATFLMNTLQGLSVMGKAKLPAESFGHVTKMVNTVLANS